MSILIKDVLLNGKETSIYIEGNRISEIGAKVEADFVIDGTDKAIFPGLVNTHTHSAMTLLRSYADDLRLQEWLEGNIWPLEAKLTEDDVYWGSKLACLEMIKTGTTCFNDMYWFMKGTARAVEEMGLRAVLAEAFIDLFKEEMAEEMKKKTRDFVSHVRGMNNERITPALGPHAIYTVSRESLEWIREFSDREKLQIHFHLAETERENEDCKRMYGKGPVEFLENIGFLSHRLIAAHSIWLKEKEIKTLRENGVKISHNPTSNLKLASGVMPYPLMRNSGISVSLGTDGCASNNNLDMFEEMKIAAITQKGFAKDPTVMPATEVLKIATINGGKALGLNIGEIKEGYLADIILIDLKRPELTPRHDLISNLVYSANGSCVDTTICNGEILMQNRRVNGEESILRKAQSVAEDLINR
ncbi:MAG: amidohydrolase [Candidatus Altiarchaeales archaeon]|nr:MAG: amidohydrolase [Candidatus Altiarchaeales archaeon]